MQLEVCVDSLDSAIVALKSGASRLEVCKDLHLGGTSPSEEFIAAIHDQKVKLNRVHIPCYAMVRPRDGDFFYTDDEFEIMRRQVEAHGSNDAIEGVVFGILTTNPTVRVDCPRTTALCRLARDAGLDVTFHRAFDSIDNTLVDALEDLIACNVPRVLTSGGASSAHQGLSVLQELVHQSRGRISIMPGGGVSCHNVCNIQCSTGVGEIHGSFGGCATEIQRVYQILHASK